MIFHPATIFLLFATFRSWEVLALSLPHPQTLEKRVSTASYLPGALNVYAASPPFLALDNGVNINFQTDSNFVVYANGVAQWASGVVKSKGCASPNVCELIYQGDGNLVSYFNGNPTWASNTASNRGHTLAFYDTMPYIAIFNAAGSVIWHTPYPYTPYPPSEGGGGGVGAGGGLSELCQIAQCVEVYFPPE
ncbi:hypothetical protein MMC06_005127 [Schaereria dolodes]|nr:hypothetical protein [Schaereria dolodes]